MTEPARLEERVTRLENETAEVRYLAVKADKDVADFRSVLVGHTSVLNAIREDQYAIRADQDAIRADQDAMRADLIEQGLRLKGLETQMNEGFARMSVEVAKNHASLSSGQDRLMELLSKHLAECGQG